MLPYRRASLLNYFCTKEVSLPVQLTTHIVPRLLPRFSGEEPGYETITVVGGLRGYHSYAREKSLAQMKSYRLAFCAPATYARRSLVEWVELLSPIK